MFTSDGGKVVQICEFSTMDAAKILGNHMNGLPECRAH